MADKIFKCAIHDFSTDTIAKMDKHCEEVEHEYDLRVDCATGCGKKIHIKVKQKLSVKSGRIPRGYMCKECREKAINPTEISEEL